MLFKRAIRILSLWLPVWYRCEVAKSLVCFNVRPERSSRKRKMSRQTLLRRYRSLPLRRERGNEHCLRAPINVHPSGGFIKLKILVQVRINKKEASKQPRNHMKVSQVGASKGIPPGQPRQPNRTIFEHSLIAFAIRQLYRPRL